jgi:C-terminal processing protease CtpA/Prc
MVSCSTKKINSLKWTPQNSKYLQHSEILSRKEIISDISTLKYALTNSYSGYFFKNKKSIDLALDKLQVKQSSISRKDFCELIAKSFRSIRDNHLTFKLGPKYCLEKSVKAKVGRRHRYRENKVWTVDRITRQNKPILLITISSFPSQSSPKWNGFLDSVQTHISKVSSIIIDLRGNGGGDDSIGFELAKLLTTNGKITTPYGPQYKITTKEGLITRWNYFKLSEHLSESEEEKSFFKNYIVNEKSKYFNNSRDYVIVNENQKKIQKSAAVKPIYILQDRACGSSCESTIDFFEFISPVTRIGENTAGSVHFTNLGFFLLPHSKIQVNVSSTFNTYLDNRFIEAVGISPDLEVKAGNDALKTAYQKINQMK